MNEYTKGPWEFDGEYVWAQSISGCVASTETEDVMSGQCVPINMAADVAKANGLLIAAAPELLEALEWAVDNPHDDAYWISQARAAIAKAKGKGE